MRMRVESAAVIEESLAKKLCFAQPCVTTERPGRRANDPGSGQHSGGADVSHSNGYGLAGLIADPWDQDARNRDLTLGAFATESDSEAHLDALVESTGLFRVRRQVWGRYLFTRQHQADKSARIDRILIPNDDAIALGWNMGPVGVECKRSDVKIGPPISQALDYSRAIWEPTPGLWLSLSWVFVWPMAAQYGPVGSILSQQRLGSLFRRRDDLVFTSGQQMLASVSGDRTRCQIRTSIIEAAGRKVGSR